MSKGSKNTKNELFNILNRYDPVLINKALMELHFEEIKSDNAKILDSIKSDLQSIYDKLPSDKNRISLISQALQLLAESVSENEVVKIKEQIQKIDKSDWEDLKAATDEHTHYGATVETTPGHLHGHACANCIDYQVGCDPTRCVGFSIGTAPGHLRGHACANCIDYQVGCDPTRCVGFSIGTAPGHLRGHACANCIDYQVGCDPTRCVGFSIGTAPGHLRNHACANCIDYQVGCDPTRCVGFSVGTAPNYGQNLKKFDPPQNAESEIMQLIRNYPQIRKRILQMLNYMEEHDEL